MRREVCLGLLVLAALSIAGCDSDQPLQVSELNGDLVIRANNAKVFRFRTWALYEDSNNDSVPDDINGNGQTGDTSLWCESFDSANVSTVPWTYSLRVRVLRDGTTEYERLTSVEAESASANRSDYDDAAPSHSVIRSSVIVTHNRGKCSGNALIRCNPTSSSTFCASFGAGSCGAVYTCQNDPATVCPAPAPSSPTCGGDPCILGTITRTFKFDNQGDYFKRRILSAANREVMDAPANFIVGTCKGDAVCEAKVRADLGVSTLSPALGECPGSSFGNAVIDPFTIDPNGDPAVFGFNLNKGDTLEVSARLSNVIPGGGQIVNFLEFPGLTADVFVEGLVLQPDEVIGDLTSATGDSSPNFRFYYTSR